MIEQISKYIMDSENQIFTVEIRVTEMERERVIMHPVYELEPEELVVEIDTGIYEGVCAYRHIFSSFVL